MNLLRIFLLAALVLVVFGTNNAEAENNTTVDAPDFTLKDTDGSTFKLSDYEDDKTLVILFMFSTCEPTAKFVKEALEPYSEKMDSDDVAILSVSVFGNDDENELRDYAESYGWRHALGDSEGDIDFAYDVVSTPKIFIIDKNGEITYSHIGPISQNKLEEEVYNATLKYEEEIGDGEVVEDKSSLSSTPMILALISIGLIAIFRRK